MFRTQQAGVWQIQRETRLASWILMGSYHTMNLFSIQGPGQWETLQASFSSLLLLSVPHQYLKVWPHLVRPCQVSLWNKSGPGLLISHEISHLAALNSQAPWALDLGHHAILTLISFPVPITRPKAQTPSLSPISPPFPWA